ncbi:MAG: LolA family protein [Steroidobacteraceae bacterium]
MSKQILTLVAASSIACAMAFAPGAHAATRADSPGTSAASQGSTPLDRYLRNLKTLRVSFLQTVADAHGAEVGRASGTLTVERPGKFRWNIHPQTVVPGAAATASGRVRAEKQPAGAAGSGQLMVCDGRNVWYYDRDLQQVTVRPVTAALSATPVMLLSGTVDVRKHFTERSAGVRDGLDWVYVEPRSAAADFKSALFGFGRKGRLQRMILEDKLGQTVTIVFRHVEVNLPVPGKDFTFTPPAGADVIGTPAK